MRDAPPASVAARPEGTGSVLVTPTRAATVLSLGAVPTVSLTLVLTVLLAPPSVSEAVVAVVVVVGFLVGVPHGAVDHLVPGRRRPTWRVWEMVVLMLAYVGCAAAVWAVWHAAPAPALAAFLVLSVLHFGSGEVTFAALRAGSQPGRRWPSAVVVGCVVVVLPMVAHPDQVAPYLAALVPGWDGRLATAPALAVVTATTVAALALALCLSVRGRRLEAAEVVALLGSALVAPAAVSLAVYFGAWHSVRHLALLLAEDPANRQHLLAARLGRPATRLALQAALPSAAALLVLALLWASASGDVHQFVAVDVPLLAALTVPHAAVVWWSDHHRAPLDADRASSARPARTTSTELHRR